jgi:AcrR family transcriptional regulator
VTDTADSRQRILDEAIRVIDSDGASAVRVARVAEAAGVTQGMVSYHFATRERLVSAAHAQRYGASMGEDVDMLLAAIGAVTCREELEAMTAGLTDVVLSAARAQARRVRASALGYAMSNDDLREAISVEHTKLIDGFTLVFKQAADQGLFRSEFDSRALATVIAAYAFGLVLMDFDENPPALDEVAKVINAFVSGALV